MDRPLKWIEVPMNLVLWVAMAAGALMMLQIVVDVGGRTFFNAPLEGSAEVVTFYYMVTIAYLPWAWVARTDGHIKVDFVARMLSDRVNFWMDLAVKLGLVAYLFFFTRQTWLEAIKQTGRSEIKQAGSFYIPVWPTRWMLPLAGGLMALWLALYVLDRLIKHFRGAK